MKDIADFTAIALCLTLFVGFAAFLTVTANAETDMTHQHCADGQVPHDDYFGVHYKSASNADAKAEFERRGYQISSIRRVVNSIGCNDARRYVANAWHDCKVGKWEFQGSYDATLGQSCAVFAFQGEYAGPETASPAGAGVCGFGRGGC